MVLRGLTENQTLKWDYHLDKRAETGCVHLPEKELESEHGFEFEKNRLVIGVPSSNYRDRDSYL